MSGGMHSGFGFGGSQANIEGGIAGGLGNLINEGQNRKNLDGGIEGGIAGGLGNLINEGSRRNNIEGGIGDGFGNLLGSRSQGNFGNMNNSNVSGLSNNRNNLPPPPPFPSNFWLFKNDKISWKKCVIDDM